MMRKVGFIIHRGYSPMGFAVSTAFEVANLVTDEMHYDVRMLSEHGGPVRTSLGFEVVTEAFAMTSHDLIVIGGAMQDASPETVDFVQRAPQFVRRVAATCVAAFVLAEAGLLDGRRATTH